MKTRLPVTARMPHNAGPQRISPFSKVLLAPAIRQRKMLSTKVNLTLSPLDISGNGGKEDMRMVLT
jgi:hypothetical protein